MLYQLSYFRNFMWAKMDSNHRRRKPADLQSAPFGHSGICPFAFEALSTACRVGLFLNCDAKILLIFESASAFGDFLKVFLLLKRKVLVIQILMK